MLHAWAIAVIANCPREALSIPTTSNEHKSREVAGNMTFCDPITKRHDSCPFEIEMSCMATLS